MTTTAVAPWCQTHTETVRRDGLVPATNVDPFGRSQCDRCFRTGELLRNGTFVFRGQFAHFNKEA